MTSTSVKCKHKSIAYTSPTSLYTTPGFFHRSSVYYDLFQYHCRGVAQLIARAVWDREVEGLSPFTPTKLEHREIPSEQAVFF